MEKILSLDPASLKNLGIAIIEIEKDNIKIIDHFTHVFKSNLENKEQRLVETKKIITKLIKKYNINMVLMELSLGFGKAFVRSQIIEITGVIKLIACEKKICVKEIAPTRIKKLVTGSGKAKKQDMKKSIMGKFNIGKKDIGTEHEVDAIGVAFAHFVETTTSRKE